MAYIAENTQLDFDNAEAVVIDMLQTSHPGISLRRGTVLRDLLVRPVAEIYAADTRRVDESMRCRSLSLLRDSGTATEEEVNAILSNFSTSLYSGKTASGYLFVQVDEDRAYGISADSVFTTSDGLNFVVSRAYVATSADMEGEGYLKLRQSGNGNWYFLLPVQAESSGTQYEIDAGVRLQVSPEFDGLIAATSYAPFTGGGDAQTIQEAIDNLAASVSLRGMDSRLAVKATLLDRNAGNFSGVVLDCSLAGCGDACQIRDKSNVFGVATGGKVDLFVRSYSAPPVVTLTKTGRWDSARGVYVIEIGHDEVPGYYALRSVTDPESVGGFGSSDKTGFLASNSYQASERFSVSGVPGIHFIPDSVAGAAWTSYRDIEIDVEDAGHEDEEERDFVVSVYASPSVSAVQEYVDREDVRSLRNDVLVRMAPLCVVSLSATVGLAPGASEPDIQAMKKAVQDYINSRSFVRRLSASEIVGVLNGFGISRVEMMHGSVYGFRMDGRIRDASGRNVYLSGPDLDIGAFRDPANLVDPDTVCFGINVEDINISVIRGA